MNERLPYEEKLTQQLADLPLPDENMAWADMKRRLEDDDDGGIIPIWLRGCGLWGLLSIVLLGIGWWLFRQKKIEPKSQQTQNTESTSKSPERNNNKKNDTINAVYAHPDGRINRVDTSIKKNTAETLRHSNTPIETGRTRIEDDSRVLITTTTGKAKRIKKPGVDPRRQEHEVNNTKVNTNQIGDKGESQITSEPASKRQGKDKASLAIKTEPLISITDSLKTTAIKKTDTIRTVQKDSVKKKEPEEPVKNNLTMKDSSKPKSISFSAGIAIHQLLPVAGQKLTPYNSQGRKSSLADYIPSVYFRMQKNNKWFLQSEFRYGAPQYNREILYQQKGVTDTFGITSTITSTKLKKTFYHQLPVSFNYFVLPGWSVGAGFTWNKFTAAVSEQDVVRRTIATGSDTVISLGTILNNRSADSNFAKSYFQAIIETQYKWKRFSLGARYSFGLQPYLTFTLPGGATQQEKNKSLQVFLRYDIWRSKEKTK